jgi:hypothetical protein
LFVFWNIRITTGFATGTLPMSGINISHSVNSLRIWLRYEFRLTLWRRLYADSFQNSLFRFEKLHQQVPYFSCNLFQNPI